MPSRLGSHASSRLDPHLRQRGLLTPPLSISSSNSSGAHGTKRSREVSSGSGRRAVDTGIARPETDLTKGASALLAAAADLHSDPAKVAAYRVRAQTK